MTDWRRMAGCDGKHPFDARVIAEGIAKKMRQKGVGVYRCKSCECWHIGGHKKSGKRIDLSKKRPKYGWHRDVR